MRLPLRIAINQKVIIVRTVLLHVVIGDDGVRVLFGAVRNLVMSATLAECFIDKFVKGMFQPEHKIAPYNSAPVPIIATVVRMENEQHQELQEDDNFEEFTAAEYLYEVPQLIRLERQTKVPLNSEGVVLVTTEERGLHQVDALLD